MSCLSYSWPSDGLPAGRRADAAHGADGASTGYYACADTLARFYYR